MNTTSLDELEILTPVEISKLFRSELTTNPKNLEFFRNCILAGIPLHHSCDSDDNFGPLHLAAKLGEVNYPPTAKLMGWASGFTALCFFKVLGIAPPV